MKTEIRDRHFTLMNVDSFLKAVSVASSLFSEIVCL